MFCQKCGTQNDDTATFCNKCGENLSNKKSATDMPTHSNSNIKEIKAKLSSANILNIVATVIMAVSFLILSYMLNQDLFTSNSSSGNSSTTITISVGGFPSLIYITCIGLVILFFIGIFIFKASNVSKQKSLSIIALTISIPLCAFTLLTSLANSLATCGVSFLLLASSIMQIVASAKFYTAIKLYENE